MSMPHPLKAMIFLFVAFMGWIGWSMMKTHVASSNAVFDVMISQTNELDTGKTDQKSAMMDDELKKLDAVRPSAVAADAAFQGLSGIKGEAPKMIDGAKMIVEERRQELLARENAAKK